MVGAALANNRGMYSKLGACDEERVAAGAAIEYKYNVKVVDAPPSAADAPFLAAFQTAARAAGTPDQLRFDAFMRLALYDATVGYYRAADPSRPDAPEPLRALVVHPRE